MTELLARMMARPWIAAELVIASLVASLLALGSSIFTILVLNRYVGYGVDTTLATLTAGVVMVIALECGFRQARLKLAQSVTLPKNRALGNRAFETLTGAKASAIEGLPSGLKREIVAGTETVQSAYSAPNLCALLDVPMALVFLGALSLLSAALAAIATAFIVGVFVLSLALLSSLRGPAKELATASARRGGIIGSAIAGADTVRAFNSQPFLRRLWRKQSLAWEALRKRVADRQSLILSINATAQALMSVSLTGVGAILVVKNHLDIGAMIGANILATRALSSIAKLAHLAQEFAKARQALETLGDFAKLPLERGGGTGIAKYSGRLEFKDLGFLYSGAAMPLFESFSLALEPGSIVVVAGGNGTGKTTLARLIVGLLEPRRGQILADGVDLQQVSPAWWRRQIVYLPQEPRFLNGSLRSNLLAANPDLDEAAIQGLIDAAGLRAHIDRSPGGLNAPIVNDGDNLSLGLRRRLALARALAGDGTLVLFDEPTEGLDADGMAHVYRLMNELAQRGRTIVAFSHDPNIVKGANAIVDLNAKPTPKIVWLRAHGAAAEETRGLKEVKA